MQDLGGVKIYHYAKPTLGVNPYFHILALFKSFN
jgi:hypothetical protein